MSNNPSNPKAQVFADPQLADNTIMQINDKLITGLAWLDFAYGKSQRLVEIVNGTEYFKPAIYVGGSQKKEYLTLTPDEHKGQFCFWDFPGDEQTMTWSHFVYNDINRGFGLTFFGRLDKIYGDDWQQYSIENVKREITDVLLSTNILGGSLTVTTISERAENVLPGYSHTETNNQYLMAPYFGVRFSGNLKIRVQCNLPPT